jgi:N6-adenosine-specific RNA methylase IME4
MTLSRESHSRYRTIVADPPWAGITARIGSGGRRRHATSLAYGERLMSVDELASVPVADVAAPDAHLFLWATRKAFREGDAARVARAWGFEPCGEIIWGLENPGTGSRSIANDHEPILVGARGSLAFTADVPMGVYFWRQLYVRGPSGVPEKVHSGKPHAFLDYVERWSPGPYAELFARRARFGWSYPFGDQALGGVAV